MAINSEQVPTEPVEPRDYNIPNRYVVKRQSDSRLCVRDGMTTWPWVLLCLTCVPVAMFAILRFDLDWAVAFFIVFAPILGAISFAMGPAMMRRLSRTITVDHHLRHIMVEGLTISASGVPGGCHSPIPLQEVVAVQFLDAGPVPSSRHWASTCQLNVVLAGDPPERHTLIETDRPERLRTISQQLADHLNVPLLDHGPEPANATSFSLLR